MRKFYLFLSFLIFGLLCLSPNTAGAQNVNTYSVMDQKTQAELSDTLSVVLADGHMIIGKPKINRISFYEKEQQLNIYFNAAMAEYPFRKETVPLVHSIIKTFLPVKYQRCTLTVYSDNKEISELIPVYYGGTASQLSTEEKEKNRERFELSNKIFTSKKQLRKNSRRGNPEEIASREFQERRKEEINKQKMIAQAQMAVDAKVQSRHDWPNLGPTPLIVNEDKAYTITNGLNNKHLAVWQSHGYYYEQKLLRWEWQRARIFQTVEDLYTQSYVLPFLVPMLENAGAIVLLPRERDTQINEVIVDNNAAYEGAPVGSYVESNGRNVWTTAEENAEGFANAKVVYTDLDNPFKMGTFRQVNTYNPTDKPSRKRDAGNGPSTVTWTPNIPQAGSYGVYVSYKSLPLSARDAQYTVHHKGGESHFRINQQMGGGTWIYLGTFMFNEGENANGCVTLTNQSNEKDAVITADAVKFGGGMGNIGRFPQDSVILSQLVSSDKSKNPEFTPITSTYPRFTEGARYWLQWAGYPDSVYTYYLGANDYTDDYTSRGRWVNTLTGGSAVNPTNPGMNIPIDLSFAFHSDAGTTLNDSIIGTLAIYTRDADGIEYLPLGETRLTSRDLTDIVQTQIVNDIRAQWNPDWTRRGIWNRSYAESRLPHVPAMLLELLSHQNLADMRYGLDPAFRFTVSRAIYKGMLRYLSSVNGTEYVVQPLPVNSFQVTFKDSQTAKLSWEPTVDELEPSAESQRYIVYTRKGDENQAFDQGVVVTQPHISLPIEKGVQYSYKVTAVNTGGESFPSEVLSIYSAPESKGTVLIVNGFTRVSAPDSYASADSCYAGFTDNTDHGVPYLQDISFIGSQYEFRRVIPWMDDDSPGFGSSYPTYETKVLPGNTFDYPVIHGTAFAQAGYSYASASAKAFYSEVQAMETDDYEVIDLILGKQKQIRIGGVKGNEIRYTAFPAGMQHKITVYMENGGNILISGANVASDIWDGEEHDALSEDFATKILHYKWRSGMASKSGEVMAAPDPRSSFYTPAQTGKVLYKFDTELNDKIYPVESPDALEPADPQALTIFRYVDNNFSAGVAYKDSHSASVVIGFPIETLQTAEQRARLVEQCLSFFKTDK